MKGRGRDRSDDLRVSKQDAWHGMRAMSGAPELPVERRKMAR